MRIDLAPILDKAQALLSAIEAQSQSRASHAAHVLLCTLPDPIWAETAPGCRIYYGIEQEADLALNRVRRHTMIWLQWLIEERQPDDEWSKPRNLIEAVHHLESFMH